LRTGSELHVNFASSSSSLTNFKVARLDRAITLVQQLVCANLMTILRLGRQIPAKLTNVAPAWCFIMSYPGNDLHRMTELQ
jgi:hypothetical protein